MYTFYFLIYYSNIVSFNVDSISFKFSNFMNDIGHTFIVMRRLNSKSFVL